MHKLEKLLELRNILFKFHSIKMLMDHKLVEKLDYCAIGSLMTERRLDRNNLVAWSLVNRVVSDAFLYPCDAVSSKVDNFG